MDEVETFKKALRGGYGWNRMQIKRLDEEIAQREHNLTGLGRPGRDYVAVKGYESMPMPHFQPGTGPSLAAKIYELDELKKEKEVLERQYAPLNLLEPTDKQMMLDLFYFEISPYDVADKYGYSVSGMYKRVDTELKKILS